MSEERNLAVLRAAERVLQIAFRWLPYSDECPDHLVSDRSRDDAALTRDAEIIRKALADAEDAVLNIAEHAGAKGLR